MSLSDLPPEILLQIADNLPGYRDIRALRASTRDFHALFESFHFSSPHGSVRAAAELGDCQLVTEILDRIAISKAHKHPESKFTYTPNDTTISGIDDWVGVHCHPLFSKGYSPVFILEIQLALLIAARAKFKKLVALLLDRGAEREFGFPDDICDQLQDEDGISILPWWLAFSLDRV